MKVTVDELMIIIGKKDVELFHIKGLLAKMVEELDKLKKEQSKDGDRPNEEG